MRPTSRRQNPLHQVILIQTQAAAKPPAGAPCNGCGVCCLAEPCPLGVLLSLSRAGPCKALRWHAPARQYRCGALGTAALRKQMQPPTLVRHWLSALARLRLRVLSRWIAAGLGCDCDLEVQPSATMAGSSPASDKHHD